MHTLAFRGQYKPRNYGLRIISWLHLTHIHFKVNIMDATHYWPFAGQYSVWNTTVAALQFWRADLEPHILRITIELVYTAFFCSDSSQQLQNLPEDIPFSLFVTTLNNTFETELPQEDEGYESGSKSLNIYTPLRRAPRWYHVLKREILSFGFKTLFTTAEQQPVHSPQRSHSHVCHHLVFNSSDEESPERPSNPHLQHSSTPDSSLIHRRVEPPLPVQHHTSTPTTEQFFQDDTADEDFSTAPLDDDVWLEDPIPDIPLCIHDTSQLDHLCHYFCPYVNLNFEMDLPPAPALTAVDFGYDLMDLNDVSADLEDIMTMMSHEHILDLEYFSDCLDDSQIEHWFA